jgi:bifunctional enzyme CysN/CysC
MVRRYGEVARLLVDTGLIVVSTTNAFSLPLSQIVQTIRTLVHPTPVIIVHMSKVAEDPPPHTDLQFAGPKDFDTEARRIIEELKRRGVLAHAIGAQPTFQYSI